MDDEALNDNKFWPCPMCKGGNFAALADQMRMIGQDKAGAFAAAIERVYRCSACGWIVNTVERQTGGRQSAVVAST